MYNIMSAWGLPRPKLSYIPVFYGRLLHIFNTLAPDYNLEGLRVKNSSDNIIFGHLNSVFRPKIDNFFTDRGHRFI